MNKVGYIPKKDGVTESSVFTLLYELENRTDDETGPRGREDIGLMPRLSSNTLLTTTGAD